MRRHWNTSEVMGKMLRQAYETYWMMPPRHDGWFANDDSSELYHLRGDFSYDVYSCSQAERRTRRPTFQKIRNVVGDIKPSRLVSVDVYDEWFVMLLSTAQVPRAFEPRMSFLDTLHSWPNQSLWRYFKCDGDGEWIRRAIMMGTL